jgi:hypothetical protein
MNYLADFGRRIAVKTANSNALIPMRSSIRVNDRLKHKCIKLKAKQINLKEGGSRHMVPPLSLKLSTALTAEKNVHYTKMNKRDDEEKEH